MQKKQVTVQVTPWVYDYLEALAAKNQDTMSRTVRQMVERHIIQEMIDQPHRMGLEGKVAQAPLDEQKVEWLMSTWEQNHRYLHPGLSDEQMAEDVAARRRALVGGK